MARSITCVFAQGKTVQKMTVVGETKKNRHEDHLQARPGDLSRHTGVQIRDPSPNRLRELAFLNPASAST